MYKLNKFVLCVFVVIISSYIVTAGDAPPPIPSEFWGEAIVNGAPAPDDLTVEGFVDGTDYAQPSTTINGYYDVILAGGDRELTYESDPDCDYHWNTLNEACVPCTPGVDCIEGPQDGEIVTIKINDNGNMPFVEWLYGSSEQVEVVQPIGDWDKAGCVDMADFGFFANHYGEIPSSTEWDDIYDLIKDYTVDMADFGVFANHYGEGCS